MAGTQRIIIAGAGVFGTSVAERLAWNPANDITLYTQEKSVVDDITGNHRNSHYFPTRSINEAITATDDIGIFTHADYIFLAIPSKAIVPFSRSIKELTQKECLVVNLAKGMSDEGAFITEDIPFRRTASMKGPTFAIEVLNGSPSAFTFGGIRTDYDELKKNVLAGTGIYLDYTADIRGVELMSVLKNMYAIAIGLVSGRYNSPNVDFLVYTKAAHEMRRFLVTFGCDEETFFRYCGMGDLGLTSLNDLSRNRTLGLLIGKGFNVDQTTSSTVTEGYRTIRLMGEMTRHEANPEDFPLVQALYRLMYEKDNLNDYFNAVFA